MDATEAITSTLESHSHDTEACKVALHKLMLEDRPQFARGAARILASGAGTPGLQNLATFLSQSEETLRDLCNPEIFDDRPALIELGKRLAKIEPEMDTKLLRLLPGRGSDPANGISAEHVLALLDAASQSQRIVARLAHLIHDSNPRLRAKAALLIGRRVRSARALEERLKDSDPRVRANAIESLWGDRSGWSAGVLQRSLKDPDNRVVGNALFGLYKLQDGSANALILELAARPEPAFRATAAWVMGQTGDAQFLPPLEKLARDLYVLVRRNATSAIRSISEH